MLSKDQVVRIVMQLDINTAKPQFYVFVGTICML